MDPDFELWLQKIGLESYASVFKDNDVDFRTLELLSDSDLKGLGVTLGHRRLLATEAARRSRGNPPPLTKQDLTAGVPALDAERRQVSVVFCDIVGATRLSHQLDPEDLRDVLLRYQNTAVASVVRYGGYVAKFLGDGILAYFGWPQAYEDQAERAVHAALDAVHAVKAIHVSGHKYLQARAGIATGEVIVGDLIGDASTDEQAIIGETPNLAARLQSEAQPNEIVIEANTKKLISTTFTLEDIGARPIKGLDQDVRIWKVHGEGCAANRFQAARGDVVPVVLGRETEFSHLSNCWDKVVAGQGKVVLTVGEAGIGKSALVASFVQSTSTEANRDWHCQCSPYHVNSALFPIRRQLMRWSGGAGKHSDEIKFNKFESCWMANSGRASDLPFVATLLDFQVDDSGLIAMTPQQKREKIVDALLQQVEAQSSSSPVLFVVEDTHWVDPSTAGFLKRLAARIADKPVLLLITTRPVPSAVIGEGQHVSVLNLDGLPTNTSASVVRLVGGNGLDQGMINEIVDRSSGNPLCLEELTKSVLEHGPPDARTLEENPIPMTLQSSLVARLDQLNTAKEMAQIGAVIGPQFSYQLLCQLSQKSGDEIASSLERLVRSGLVVERVVGGELSYAFKHALVHDAAYGTILKSQRRTLHRRIIDIIEEQDLRENSSGRKIEQVALHAMRAELWEKALDFSQLAASKALDQSALHEAIALYNQALEAAENLAQSREIIQCIIDIRLKLRNALWSAGANDEIIKQLSIAEQRAAEIGDERRLGWIWVYRGASLWLVGRNEEARSVTEMAVKAGEAASDVSLQIAADFYLGCALVQCGEYVIAVDRFERIISLTVDHDVADFLGLPFAPAIVARSWLIWSLAELGRFDDALQVADDGLELANKLKHPFSHAHILYDIGYLHLLAENYDAAFKILTEAHQMTHHWKLGNLELFVAGFLGCAQLRRGDVEGAIELLADCVKRYEMQGSGLFHSLVLIHLAEAQNLAGRKEEALKLGNIALDLTRSRGERGHQAYALYSLGVASDKDKSAAQYFFKAALEIADKCSMQPLGNSCRSSLVQIEG